MIGFLFPFVMIRPPIAASSHKQKQTKENYTFDESLPVPYFFVEPSGLKDLSLKFNMEKLTSEITTLRESANKYAAKFETLQARSVTLFTKLTTMFDLVNFPSPSESSLLLSAIKREPF